MTLAPKVFLSFLKAQLPNVECPPGTLTSLPSSSAAGSAFSTALLLAHQLLRWPRIRDRVSLSQRQSIGRAHASSALVSPTSTWAKVSRTRLNVCGTHVYDASTLSVSLFQSADHRLAVMSQATRRHSANGSHTWLHARGPLVPRCGGRANTPPSRRHQSVRKNDGCNSAPPPPCL